MTNSIAVIVAHPDDEVLGCGGTIARLAKEGREINVLIMADGESSRGNVESVHSAALSARKKAANLACKILGCASVSLLGLADNRLDHYDLLDIVRHVESFIQKYKPTTILTHHSDDLNIDHRVVHESVIVASRPTPGFCVKELLFFEVPSSTEWRSFKMSQGFSPNWFCDISSTFEIKKKALEFYYEELRDFPHPRSMIAIDALNRWRGANVGCGLAEAFMLGRKLV